MRRDDPVIRGVSRTFLDIDGNRHASFADAYRASVKAKLCSIIRASLEPVYYGPTACQEIADAIMKEMVVAWG